MSFVDTFSCNERVWKCSICTVLLAPDIVCLEQCDRLSLTQLLPWAKSVNGRAPEVDVSLCLMVHPPSLRLCSLQQLSRPRDRCGGGGGGSYAVHYTTPTLSTPIINGLSEVFLCFVLVGRARSQSRKLYFLLKLVPWFVKSSTRGTSPPSPLPQ